MDEGFGIRLIKDKKITSTQTTNEDKIEKAIDEAAKTFTNLKPIKFWGGLPCKVENQELEGTFDERLDQISGSKSIDIAQNMIQFFHE